MFTIFEKLIKIRSKINIIVLFMQYGKRKLYPKRGRVYLIWY